MWLQSKNVRHESFRMWSAAAVECRTCNQVSPGSNPPLLPFRRLGIFVLSIDAPVDCINEYLATDSGGNVSDLVIARNCDMAI